MINFTALLCHERLHRVKDGNTLSEVDCSVNTQVVLQGQLCSVFAVVSKPTAVIKVIKMGVENSSIFSFLDSHEDTCMSCDKWS